MATVDALNAPPLEFVHATSADDIMEAERLVGDNRTPIRDLEPLMPTGPAAGMAPDHCLRRAQG